MLFGLMPQIEKLPKNVARFRRAGANLEADSSLFPCRSTDQELSEGRHYRFSGGALFA
jgi:hypothetical protein